MGEVILLALETVLQVCYLSSHPISPNLSPPLLSFDLSPSIALFYFFLISCIQNTVFESKESKEDVRENAKRLSLVCKHFRQIILPFMYHSYIYVYVLSPFSPLFLLSLSSLPFSYLFLYAINIFLAYQKTDAS